jgi:hypothetical protein
LSFPSSSAGAGGFSPLLWGGSSSFIWEGQTQTWGTKMKEISLFYAVLCGWLYKNKTHSKPNPIPRLEHFWGFHMISHLFLKELFNIYFSGFKNNTKVPKNDA